MERHVRRLLNRVSIFLATIATASLLHLFRHSSASCFPSPVSAAQTRTLTLTVARAPFPRSSCDAASRRLLPPDLRLSKLRSSRQWHRRTAALSVAAFSPLRRLRLLSNSSHVLVSAAAPGLAVDALHNDGVADVTGVDVVDFPPLVRRADPHNLPFFDGVFDLAFAGPGGVAGALFPARFAAEMERTVRRGGAIVLAVEKGVAEVDGVTALFKRSRLSEVRNVAFGGTEMSLLIMKTNGTNPH